MESSKTSQCESSRIRGRRFVLYNVDLEREIAWPVAMAKSRDWLAYCGAKLARPAVIEIDATEATQIARRGVLPLDDTTIAEIARAVGCSRKLIVRVLRELTAKERSAAKCQCGTLVPTPPPAPKSDASA